MRVIQSVSLLISMTVSHSSCHQIISYTLNLHQWRVILWRPQIGEKNNNNKQIKIKKELTRTKKTLSDNRDKKSVGS